MDKALRDLLDILSITREKAIKRRELCERLNWCDSFLREVVKYGREQGNMICANTDNGGYYIGTSDADYRMLKASYYKRVKSLVKTMKKLSENYGEGLQIDMQDLLGDNNER